MVWQTGSGSDSGASTDAQVVASEGDLTVRLLRNDDEDIAAMVRWRAQPHVHAWWDPDGSAPTFEEAAALYGARTHPSSPTTPCVIQLGERPIGYLQFYKWASFPVEAGSMGVEHDEDTFGLDLFIGEPELVGHGIGSRTVDLLCRYLEQERGATRTVLLTETTNARARRAYEKAGFTKVRAVLDMDTRDGERMRCWLMERVRG